MAVGVLSPHQHTVVSGVPLPGNTIAQSPWSPGTIFVFLEQETCKRSSAFSSLRSSLPMTTKVRDKSLTAISPKPASPGYKDQVPGSPSSVIHEGQSILPSPSIPEEERKLYGPSLPFLSSQEVKTSDYRVPPTSTSSSVLQLQQSMCLGLCQPLYTLKYQSNLTG